MKDGKKKQTKLLNFKVNLGIFFFISLLSVKIMWHTPVGTCLKRNKIIMITWKIEKGFPHISAISKACRKLPCLNFSNSSLSWLFSASNFKFLFWDSVFLSMAFSNSSASFLSPWSRELSLEIGYTSRMLRLTHFN